MANYNIFDVFQWTARNRPEYLAAIEKRPSGSQWGGNGYMPWQHLAALPWQQLPREQYQTGIHLRECDYFFVQNFPVLRSTQAFKLLADFTEDYTSVELRHGAHGFELVSHLVQPIPTDEAWLILGPAKDKNKELVPNQKTVWAAYPGSLTASIKHVPGFDGTLGSLIEAARSGVAIAVKGVNQ